MLGAVARELERYKIINRQLILNNIFLRLNYAELEKGSYAKLSAMINDLYLERGEHTLETLKKLIDKTVEDLDSKKVLKDLIRLLTLE